MRQTIQYNRQTWCVMLLPLFLLTGSGMQATASPTIQLDLASKTAWTFQPVESNTSPQRLAVPAGGWRLNGFPTATAGTYERRFTVPRLPGGGPQVTRIAFEAVNWEAIVSVGPDTAHLHVAGQHLSPWTPFTVDISRYAAPGQSILLRVNMRDRTFFRDAVGHYTVPASTIWNDRPGRGILRGVCVQIDPSRYIDSVVVRPNTDSNTLSGVITLVNATKQLQTVRLQGAFAAWNAGATSRYPALPARTVVLKPEERKEVAFGPLRWTAGTASWWWPNVPFRPDYRAQLHLLKWTLQDAKGALLQQDTTRFGFCTPGQKGNTYTLNGVRINLRGDSLPESAIGTDAFARLPGFLPPTASSAGWPGTVRNYQRLNYNVIRMHEAPCTRYMLDVCDELGLLVIPETAISTSENTTAMPDAFLTHLRELVSRDRNHPCVFKWSLANEPSDASDAFVQQLVAACRQADGVRPCSLDGNANYAASPGFAVIEHSSQAPGTPNAPGGTARTDRPFGQGTYIWPQSNTASGPLWFSLTTRSLREHDNADVRPYALLDIWPGVISGLNPTNFPNPPSVPDSLQQGGRSILNPASPWEHPELQLLQRSFAPVAAYDTEFDAFNTPSNGMGEWPARFPTLPAEKPVSRILTVFNDTFQGEKLVLEAQPILHLSPEQSQKLPAIRRSLTVPRGMHVAVPILFAVPAATENTLLEVVWSVLKEGKTCYRESNFYVLVPAKGGTQVAFEGRDDTTGGNWSGIYGQQGFLIPRRQGMATFQGEGLELARGTGLERPGRSAITEGNGEYESQQQLALFVDKETVEDPRVQQDGPGSTIREPLAFRAGGGLLYLRIFASDGQPHRLSLYFLDYNRRKLAEDVDILDRKGHRLDTRRIGDYENGAYIRYRFTGQILVRIRALYSGDPLVSSVFVDAVP